jgi:hypothetical protein
MDVPVEALFLSPNPAVSWIDGVVNARYALNHVGAPLQWVNPTGASFGPGCRRTRFSGLDASGGCGGDQIAHYVLEVDTNFQVRTFSVPPIRMDRGWLSPTDSNRRLCLLRHKMSTCWARLVCVLAAWASSGR